MTHRKCPKRRVFERFARIRLCRVNEFVAFLVERFEISRRQSAVVDDAAPEGTANARDHAARDEGQQPIHIFFTERDLLCGLQVMEHAKHQKSESKHGRPLGNGSSRLPGLQRVNEFFQILRIDIESLEQCQGVLFTHCGRGEWLALCSRGGNPRVIELRELSGLLIRLRGFPIRGCHECVRRAIRFRA